jgi:hypothetical protein
VSLVFNSSRVEGWVKSGAGKIAVCYNMLHA